MADTAMLPPPDLRVPAIASPSLPSLTGEPVVPPPPRIPLEERDAAAASLAEADVTEPTLAGPCPSIVESTSPAPIPTLGDAFSPTPTSTPAPTADPEPTSEFPAVGGELLKSPNEPLGAPPQVAMEVPALPTLGDPVLAPNPGTAIAEPPAHQPSQADMVYVAPIPAPAATATAARPNSDGGTKRLIARTLAAVVLAGAVGVGTHVGFNWWQNKDATIAAGADADRSDLASWPQVGPPAIRYTDSVTTFSNDAGTRTLTAHREISSGMTQGDMQIANADGTVTSATSVDIRGEQAFVRPSPEAAWAAAAPEDAAAQLGDTWTTDVFTVGELFPEEALPYITVLESVERILPVKPLQPAAQLGEPQAAPIAISTEPTSMVWQYRVIIDTEAFRANETLVFQEWKRRLGRSAVSRLEAWIDNTGTVRQLSVDVDGTKVTHTLVGGSADSARFDTNPLLDPEPAPADPAPTEQPAVEVAE